LQALPDTYFLQLHKPVTLSQPKLPLVPIKSHEHAF
jgi:hypothetical protein